MDDEDLERLAWAIKGAIVDLDYMHPWRRRAACRGRGTADWFPARGENCSKARQVCESCPVSVECGEFMASLPAREQLGIWAGTTGRERRGRTRSDPRPEPRAAVA